MAFNLRNRSFVKLLDFTPKEIKFLLQLSADLTAAKYGGYEQPTLTGKNIALRAPAALQRSIAVPMASLWPAMTTCPGELKLTGSAIPILDASSQAAMTASSSSPRMAAIPPLPAGTALCINSERRMTIVMASAKLIACAATSAEYSPRL